jgi:hypothetical protein
MGSLPDNTGKGKRKKEGTMAVRDEAVKEILRGLDGLVMLSQWELTLAKDMREKMEQLTEGPPDPPAAGEEKSA